VTSNTHFICADWINKVKSVTMKQISISEIKSLKTNAKEIRKTVLSMIVTAHASHIASAYSVVELLVFLYSKVLRVDPKKYVDENRDRFILSKGWGISALYAVLADNGFFSKDLLSTYCQDGGKLVGISTRNDIPGVEATTGSMGHGLPLGVGMALAAKMKKKPYRVFVIISDGECDEGSTWEAILQAQQFKLDNLTVIVDYNKWQSFGRTKEVLDLEPFTQKWKAFNWSIKEIDGHDFKQIASIFAKLPFKKGRPSVIVAHTIKGKGVSVLENQNQWHYKTPTGLELEIARKELS
jgi:transketolase